MEKATDHVFNKQAIKDLLEAGERLSVKSVWLVIKTTELRHYLSQLRRDGITILSEWKEKDGKRFKEYWLASKN